MKPWACVLGILLATSATLEVSQVVIPSVLDVGGDVQLSCQYSLYTDDQLEVNYYFDNSTSIQTQFVWQYNNQTRHNSAIDNYVGRVDHIVQTSYRSGFIITLRHVTLWDDGLYKCFVKQSDNYNYSRKVPLTINGEY